MNTVIHVCVLGVSERGGTYPQPLVDTFPVELVATGQDSQQLAGLEITHTHHTAATQREWTCKVRQHKKPVRHFFTWPLSIRADLCRLVIELDHKEHDGKIHSINQGCRGVNGQHSQRLFRLLIIWIEPIGRKLFDVSLSQSSEFGFSQTFSEVQEGLWAKNTTSATTEE